MRAFLVILCLSFSAGADAAGSSLANFICEPVTVVADREQCAERASVVLREDKEEIPKGFPWFSMIWSYGWWIVYYAFGLLIGRYIYRDAKTREWLLLGIRPVWWGVAPIFEPVLGLLLYWAVHYSKFAQSYHEATAPPVVSEPGA